MISAAAFVLAFFGCVVLAFARHPIFGLYAYFLAFYIHPPSRWWGAMLPDLRWSFLAGGVAIVAMYAHRRRLSTEQRAWFATVPGAALLTFVLWFWIQNGWALAQSTHFSASVQFTKYIVAFYLVYRLAHDKGAARSILLLHVGGCFFLGLLCAFAGRDMGDRLNGVGGPGLDDANTLGMYLATGVVVGAMLVLSETGWRRIAAALAVPVMLNGLILTGSRGAFLGMVVGGLVLFYLRPPKRTWVFVAAGIVGVAGAVSLMDQKFIDRMLSIKAAALESEEMDSSAESRWVIIDAQFRMATQYPHGAGHRGTAELSPIFLDERWLTRASPDGPAMRSSHNTFMTVLVEQGIPGAIIYGWICLWVLRTVFTLRRLPRQGVPYDTVTPAAASCAAIAVIWTAGHFTDYLIAEVQFWLFAVLAASVERIRLARQARFAAAGVWPSAPQHAAASQASHQATLEQR